MPDLAREVDSEKKEESEGAELSQHLEAPRGLVLVVQTVRGVKVELPGCRGCCRRRLFVIQTVAGVKGKAGATVGLVVVVVRRVVVVVRWVVRVVRWVVGGARCLADVMGVRVS